MHGCDDNYETGVILNFANFVPIIHRNQKSLIELSDYCMIRALYESRSFIVQDRIVEIDTSYVMGVIILFHSLRLLNLLYFI